MENIILNSLVTLDNCLNKMDQVIDTCTIEDPESFAQIYCSLKNLEFKLNEFRKEL